jgi:hypothetical protein
MKINVFAGAAFLALGMAAAPAMAQDIDTSGNPYSGTITPFGTPDTSTYGQTFTVGTEAVLDGFSLYLAGAPSGTIDFKAYVYSWDGSKASGPALFASNVQHFSGNGGAPQEFAFDTTSLSLASGAKYVAFLTTSGLQAGQAGATAGMPYTGEVYGGGDFVYYNNGNNFAALTGNNWDYAGGGFGDTYFKADFSASAAGVPEPAAWGMLIGGFGFAGAALRTRARQVRFAIA